ncbi:MAG TPA: response regulator [Isosphaeraceae bacterium]|jgi:chemotaxis protein histidine kinase CheA/CheY-like chemotaxis protein|nr:response regulator [Isosphaeraceae bacterium]
MTPPEAEALRRALIALRDRFTTAGADPGLSPGRDLAAARDEADALGLSAAADALARLALLAEVGDCLRADAPEAAADVLAFLARGLDDLVRHLEHLDGPGLGALAAAILRDSADRWGDYLALLDPDAAGSSNDRNCDWNLTEESVAVIDDAPAVDAAALLRLLTGGTSVGPEAEDDGPEEEPSAIDARRPAVVPAKAGPRAAPPAPAIPRELAMDEELKGAFLEDAGDLFDRLERGVLGLGEGPGQDGPLHEIGRALHTLKGAAGSVGLSALAAEVHALEDQLEEAGGVASADLIAALFGALRDLEAVLNALRRGPAPAGRTEAKPAAVVAEQEAPRPVPDDAPAAEDDGPIRVASAKIEEMMDWAAELLARRGAWGGLGARLGQCAATATGCRRRLLAIAEGLGGEGPAASRAEALARLDEQAADLAVLAESARAAATALADEADALGRLGSQLWEALQGVRVVPVRGLFQRLARVARDAAQVEGRRVEVATVGEGAGIDRFLQERAFEPLLHVVRNAVGHGLEPPEARVAAGKAPSGRVTLEARREGNALVLAVEDDGRGLDYAAIEAKGRRLGLIRPDERPTTERLGALIFESGFSTRAEANAISGRGVGMDIVARDVAALRGTITLTSRPGQGTRLTARLPARLALEQMMVVRVAGQAFALPLESIERVRAVDDEETGAGPGPSARIETARVLGLAAPRGESCPKLVIVRADGEAPGVVVDAIDGPRELVIRPLGPLLAGHPFVSGTSALMTGEVVLVLDPTALARVALGGGAIAPAPPAPAEPAAALVVDDSVSVRRVAVRLLGGLGLVVDEAADGLEALGRLRKRPYRVVLSDLEMPRMDGFELLAELNRAAGPAAPPVVVASTRSDPATRDRVLGLGARAFLAKPFGADELARLVGDIVAEGAQAVAAAIP